VWQTDGQTDGRTDRITTPKIALAYACAVKTSFYTVTSRILWECYMLSTVSIANFYQLCIKFLWLTHQWHWFFLITIIIQVMWLVVTEVRSESFGLIAECRHYNGQAGYRALSLKWTSHVATVFSSSGVVSHAFSGLLYVCTQSSSIILIP